MGVGCGLRSRSSARSMNALADSPYNVGMIFTGVAILYLLCCFCCKISQNSPNLQRNGKILCGKVRKVFEKIRKTLHKSCGFFYLHHVFSQRAGFGGQSHPTHDCTKKVLTVRVMMVAMYLSILPTMRPLSWLILSMML